MYPCPGTPGHLSLTMVLQALPKPTGMKRRPGQTVKKILNASSPKAWGREMGRQVWWGWENEGEMFQTISSCFLNVRQNQGRDGERSKGFHE